MDKIRLNASEWMDFRSGEKKCFLLTNGLGGYCSLTVMGNAARNDQALLMGALKAPTVREHLISNVWETLELDGESVDLFSQEFVNRTQNVEGFRFLEGFEMGALPTWFFRVKGVEIEKTVGMVQGENTVLVRYRVRSGKKGVFSVRPVMRFAAKGEQLQEGQDFAVDRKCIASNGVILYYGTNGELQMEKERVWRDLFFEQDARDGRDGIGSVAANHRIRFVMKGDGKEQVFFVVYSLADDVDKWDEERIALWIESEEKREEEIAWKSGILDPAGRRLAVSASQYITERASTGGKSIMAGFPYFADWGRDTMISLPGCTLAVGEPEVCKSILRTFMAYTRKGLMPNLFPEGDEVPMYNTVDAALLFLDVVYAYYLETGDLEFVREAFPVMEDVVYWYQKGTDFHIKMDEDGLISAGDGLEQVTWMDVRIDKELPTPRHGKPVEINAYWYNGLKVMEELAPFVGKDGSSYGRLAQRVKESFLSKFWMEEEGYLKDVLNGTAEERQFRCNQVFGLALPFQMVNLKQGQRILRAVKEKLYTTAGLRSLAMDDPAFHSWYGGSQPERDRAYHQGTVWGFPLGAYFRAILKYFPEEGKQEVRRGLDRLESWLNEGCLFHLAEIYDGAAPVMSKGCYAQAWSVGEILRVYHEMEGKKMNPVLKRTPAEWKSFFESKEFVDKYTYEGEDLGVTVKQREKFTGEVVRIPGTGNPDVSAEEISRRWKDEVSAVSAKEISRRWKDEIFQRLPEKGSQVTEWKLWAPTAMEVSLELYSCGSGREKGDRKLASLSMKRGKKGVWSCAVEGAWYGVYYTYHVVHSDGTFDTTDPYGTASGIDSERSMVVDLKATNPEGWENDRKPEIRPEDRCIYELHVKDFSSDPHSGISKEHRGKFLAFTEEGTTLDGDGVYATGIDYLKSLGISHVHLLPVFDFGSVKEDDAEGFNWGYDPVQYNVPEGSYSTDPFHGEVRIREMKEMVQALHRAGIGVIMDVVYNHTYNLDSSFQKTVPYYYYREWADGSISNGSDCGNETASEREMFRRFMVRSVCYWAKEYHIDGFRFDLMALHDTETMNAIRTALNELPRGEEILVYGEPWKAAASAMQEGYFPSDKQNIGKLIDGISMFCDDTRDSIKGSVFIAAEGGYVNGKERLSAGVLSATDGWMDGKGAYEPRNASQLIPYVSAHDNYTLWDKLKLSDPKRKEDVKPDFDEMDERTLSMNRLAAGIVMTCKGMPFFQAGEEFARTKYGEGNSFKSPWQLNRLDWTRAWEQEELVDYYRDLLKLRRKFQAYGTCEPDCKKTFFRENQVAGYLLEYPDGCAVCVFYNPWEKEVKQSLPGGTWKLLCDGKRCAVDHQPTAEKRENMVLPAKAMVLLERV